MLPDEFLSPAHQVNGALFEKLAELIEDPNEIKL